MMLDRAGGRRASWTERQPADTGMALVEWLAFVGDALSYRLDHVGTEYALETARLRQSAARHARLVGYHMHDGASARVLAQVRLAPGVASFTLPASGVAFPDPDGDEAGGVITLAQGPARRRKRRGGVQPMATATLRAAHHRIALHHWGDTQATLAAGATQCDLRDPITRCNWRRGTSWFWSRTATITRRAADADPARRQAVRLTSPPEMLADQLETVPRPAAAAPEPLRVWRIRWGAQGRTAFPP